MAICLIFFHSCFCELILEYVKLKFLLVIINWYIIQKHFSNESISLFSEPLMALVFTLSFIFTRFPN